MTTNEQSDGIVTYKRTRQSDGSWYHHVTVKAEGEHTFGATTEAGKPQAQALVDLIHSIGQEIAEIESIANRAREKLKRDYDYYWQEEIAVMGEIGEIWDILPPPDYPDPKPGDIIPIRDGPPVKVLRLLLDRTETRRIIRVEIQAYSASEDGP